MNQNTHVCTACHTAFAWETPDNGMMIFFGGLGIVCGFGQPILAPLWLVGLTVIIVCVRARTKRCPTCKGKAVIPIDSPAALKIIRA